jgi:large subunit ribosomal protein L4
MATIDVRGPTGEVLEQRELPAELFEAPVNPAVMHQVVVAGMAAQRAGTHATKTRGQVRGGGVKPWRQKGTGRARHGSIRSPLWTGGGVAHGPTPRSYDMRVNKKMKRAALRSALSDAARSGKLSAVGGLAFDGPKTKDAASLLSALELEGNVLLVLAGPDENVEKSFRNIGQVKVGFCGNLSTYDVLFADRVVFTTEALDALSGEEPSGTESGGSAEAGGEDAPKGESEESPVEDGS